MPPAHDWPAGQAAPHAPQFAALVRSGTSQPLALLPSQFPKFAAHEMPHDAPEQVVAVTFAAAPFGHTKPHAPQLVGDVDTLVSQPSAVPPVQSANDALHSSRHALDTHTALAFAKGPHTVPHAPQFPGSTLVTVHAAPHSVLPVPQLAAHVPAVHTVPPPHTRGIPDTEQAPQLALSVFVFTSQPFAGLPSQSAKPALHAPIAQVPAAHVAPAFANEQRIPHPPQLFTSVARTFVSQPVLASPSQSANPAAHAPTMQADAAHA